MQDSDQDDIQHSVQNGTDRKNNKRKARIAVGTQDRRVVHIEKIENEAAGNNRQIGHGLRDRLGIGLLGNQNRSGGKKNDKRQYECQKGATRKGCCMDLFQLVPLSSAAQLTDQYAYAGTGTDDQAVDQVHDRAGCTDA